MNESYIRYLTRKIVVESRIWTVIGGRQWNQFIQYECPKKGTSMNEIKLELKISMD